MSRSKRLTDAQRMEIVREAADGVSTSVLAKRFGVTPRAVQYTLKSDDQRQRDTAVPVLAVSVKVTPDEMAAFDAVLASAGIETRSEGLRRLMQAAGGTFVADTSLAAEMASFAIPRKASSIVSSATRSCNAERRRSGRCRVIQHPCRTTPAAMVAA